MLLQGLILLAGDEAFSLEAYRFLSLIFHSNIEIIRH